MKNTIKKISAFLLSLVLLLGIVPLADLDITASAVTYTYSGTCGDNLTWYLDTAVCNLIISGKGKMYDWTSDDDVPWSKCDSYISTVTMDNGVENIGDYAFAFNSGGLNNIKLPDSITSIGDYAFYYSGLKSIDLPDSVISIGDCAFGHSFITEIEIPKNVTSIGEDTFAGCFNLESVIIPNGVTSIGDYAFSGCRNLKNTEIPDSVTSIGMYAFGHCDSLENLVIPDSVTSIGERAFASCENLKNVTIGKGLSVISCGTFDWCLSLTNVTFCNSVTSIEDNAFGYDENLTDIYYKGTQEQWNKIMIYIGNDPLFNANIHFVEHEHVYTAVVTPPTCQSQGYTTYTCAECGDSYVDDYTDTVDHYYLDGKCIWCGDTNVTPSSIIDITYTPSDSARKLFTVTCADRAQMIQFIEPDGGTRTYYRNNANVKITSYNADGEVVGELSRDLAYEVWEIYSNMSIGTTIKVRAKFQSRWELDKRSLFIYEYNPVISMELSRTSGKKGPVPATVVADEKTENVKFKMPNGTSVTVTQFTTDKNGNRVFKGNAWANEDGLNVITVTIRRKNVTKTVGTLEYTVE
ncbi:MAG: leucine-rich repeat domain-containing protein [Clostridia bacterium]|nr:leucine-rich repeat domain-containing protein [Clostridia bacterium]